MDKCPICDGTGTSNTCVNGTFKPCSFCDGTGECDANEVDRFNAVDFIKVMEMVKNPQTNEEWLKSLDTEELAKWLHTAIFDDNFANKIADKAYMNMQTRDDYIENWLREKHYEM